MGEQIRAVEPDETRENHSSARLDAKARLAGTPFAELGGRVILGGGVIVAIVTVVAFMSFVSREAIRDDALGRPVALLLFNSLYALWIVSWARRVQLDPRTITGPSPSWSLLWRNALTAVPLQILFGVSAFLFFLVLSYLFPGFVKWWFLDRDRVVLMYSRDAFALTGVMSFFAVVVMAPIVEEFVFRGLLLTRWTLKWNLQRAMIVSSAIFGLLHPEIIGAFLFGYVLCLVYLRTRSLFACIAIHSANNFLAWSMQTIGWYMDPSSKPTTIEEFQSSWWAAVILGLAITPWAIKLVRQHHNILSMGIPYVPPDRSLKANAGDHDPQSGPSTSGVLVLRVASGSNAEKVGIREGDVIVQYDREQGLTTRRLGQLICSARLQGGIKRIVFLRNGTTHSVLMRPTDLGILVTNISNACSPEQHKLSPNDIPPSSLDRSQVTV